MERAVLPRGEEPWLIPKAEAARLCAGGDTTMFLRDVRRGLWPRPVRPGFWDRQALRDRLDTMAGRVPASRPDEAWRGELQAWQP